MRVAIYVGRTPPQGGGAFTFEESILDALVSPEVKTQHSWIVVGAPGRLLAKAEAAGMPTLPLPPGGARRAFLRLPRPSVRASRRQKRFVSRDGIDAAVGGAGADFLLSLGPEVPTMDIPFSVVVWDLQHRLQPSFPEVSTEGIWRRRENYFAQVLRRAAFVVAGTEVGRDEVESFYQVPSSRIAVLPHPTPAFALAAAASGDSVQHSLEGWKEPFVFYPAQFWPHKNHLTLLKSLALLKERGGPTCTLVLAGSDWGGNKEYVMSQARSLGVAELVRDLGFVERDVLIALYRRAVALVYPSMFGPENLPPLEAFALGCPVIASDVEGAAEQLGDAALLGDGRNPEFFAKAITKMLTDSGARHQLIERGRLRAQRSTPQSFAAGLVRQLDEFQSIRETWPSA